MSYVLLNVVTQIVSKRDHYCVVGLRYEQFEISPETIEQELRPVVCE